MFCALACCGTAFAQMEKGDKEVGIGGQLLFTHTSDFTGNADLQFSLGYYLSVRNYFGFEADPTFTFQHEAATSGVTTKGTSCGYGTAGCYGGSAGSNSTNIGGFFGGNYRRLVGNPKGRVFPFVGGGGGAYVSAGSDGNSASGAFYGEGGLKGFFSQKTSIEFAYKLLYTPHSGGSFQENSLSLVTIALKHVF
jgi:hypothetical protein